METTVFIRPEVSGLLAKTIEARLHADLPGLPTRDRILEVQEQFAGKDTSTATGVTNGSIVRGVKREPGFIETETILMRSKTGSVRRMIYRNPVK